MLLWRWWLIAAEKELCGAFWTCICFGRKTEAETLVARDAREATSKAQIRVGDRMVSSLLRIRLDADGSAEVLWR